MKILSISIQNLASLEGNHLIDFEVEPLKSAGLFAITGATGAGKSTILDALCLALFDATPRYSNASDIGIEISDVGIHKIKHNDVKAILSDGTASGYSKVTFQAMDGKTYTATWSVKRAREKADGKLQDAVMELVCIGDLSKSFSHKKTELKKVIETLLGLNFYEFTRSVLLAQGEFTAFLKAANEAKSALLEKLTGTEIYSKISKSIHEKNKEESDKLNFLEVQMEGISLLDEDKLSQLLLEQKQLIETSNFLKKKMETWNQEKLDYQQRQDLQNQVQQADEKLQSNLIELNKLLPRRNEITLIKKASSTKNWFELEKNLITKIQKITDQNKINTAKLVEKKGETKGLLQQEVQIKNKIQLNENESQKSKPFIIKARNLDVQLIEYTKNISEKKDNKANKSLEIDSFTNKVEDHKKNIQSLTVLHTEKTNWFTNNKAKEPIFLQFDLINSRLKDLTKSQISVTSHENELIHIVQNEEKYQNKLSELQIKSALVQNAFQEKNRIMLELQKSLPVKKSIDLIHEKTTLDELLVQTNKHYELKEKLILAAEELKNTQESIESYELKKAKLEKDIAAYQILYENKNATYLVLEKTFEKAKVAALKNVSQLRDNLQKNEACPVCGSCAHPYIELHQLPILNEIEKSYLFEKEAVEKAKNTLSKSEYELINCLKLIQLASDTHKEQVIKHDKASKKWSDLALIDQTLAEIEIEKIHLLDQINVNKKTFEKNLKQENDFEKAKKEVELAEKNAKELEIETTEIQHLFKLENNKKTNKKLILSEDQKKHSDLLLELHTLFGSTTWLENWNKSAERFNSKLNEFVQDWKNNDVEKTRLKEQINALKITIEEQEKQLEFSKTQLQSLNEEIDKKEKQYDILFLERNQIFDGKAIIDVENNLQSQTKKLTTSFQSINTSLNTNKQEIAILETEINALEKQISSHQKELVETQSNIEKWLQQYNNQTPSAPLTMEKLIQISQIDENSILAEDEKWNLINELYTNAESILKDRSIQLENHKKNTTLNTEFTELNKLISDNEKIKIDNEKRKIEIAVYIQENEKNRLRFSEILKKRDLQQDIYSEWGKLNSLIGSSDGKKFRQLAQEFTLDALLNHANVQLSYLSPRYLIERIPQSLALQVVDQVMADDIRTVNSLSGGESFLVSLALALGLAQLSSKQMHIASLFIDEGFGSLDPETLQIAIDALERLESQGRKVGVISHVQEMTERIGVQIHVSKNPNGKSKIEIIN